MDLSQLLIFIFLISASFGVGYFLASNRHKKGMLQTQLELTEVRTRLSLSEEQKKTMVNMEQDLSNRFELLANKIFEEKNRSWSEANTKNLSLILDPLKERIKDFEKKVEENYANERAERGTLKGELSKLMELNQKMSVEAENLTRALKGDNKASGTWGEMILENILDQSGLRKGEEFETQESHTNEDGRNVRPDVVVYLPDGKHIIVDSKVSLTAYERYMQVESEDEKELAAKDHLISFQRHIEELSGKKYHTSKGLVTPDFVLLFMPIEPAFALAFKLKPDLLSYAWGKNIALVSPTTLLTTLRTVSAIWRQDRQEKNALEIAQRGGQLYDKFVLLYESLDELYTQFQRTDKGFSTVFSRLKDGNGNLLSQVEKLKELGAKASKQLPTPELPDSQQQ